MKLITGYNVKNLKHAAFSLRSGNLVAFPTETVYGLGADATNKLAIEHLYRVKARPADHPLIVHISTIENLSKWARKIPKYAIKLAETFWPGPLTLILPRSLLAQDFITGYQDNVGIRIPSHPIALDLLREFEDQGGMGIAAPSANRFGAVSPTAATHVVEELSNYLSNNDLILDGGQCEIGVESTIVDCTKTVPRILRPGAITSKDISSELCLEINLEINKKENQVKVSGSRESHYSPNAKVYLSRATEPGDGFIAISSIETPYGAIRLASPKNTKEFAKLLYQALRLADQKKLERVVVIPPEGEELAEAIRDRLVKCAKSI
jgi:L-threonylcarbamoyladenylate synthase